MKKLIVLFFFTFLITSFVKAPLTKAQVQNDYVISSFVSEIEIEKDTSINVTETINVNFTRLKHGIFRVIPFIYSAKGKTIRAKFELISITDELGKSHKFSIRNLRQSKEIKIGDPNKTIIGEVTYNINYKISKILQRFSEHDELYWNVTGSEWDTEILNAAASVKSPFAQLTKTECFSGLIGGTDRRCRVQADANQADFVSETVLGPGRDLTIVVALEKESQLVYPGRLETLISTFIDNWGYLVAVLPFSLMFYLWYRRGRDRRYLSENIYYEPDDKNERLVSVFERPHIPIVYHPIAKLSPGEVGTIIDEKVHISDLTAEILELARLKFFKIVKIEKGRLFGTSTDYAFVKLNDFNNKEKRQNLKEYQKYLLDELFTANFLTKSQKEVDMLTKGKIKNKAVFEAETKGKEYILLSVLKNKFYKKLEKFKEKLYERMGEEEIFEGNPEKVRKKWVGIYITLASVFGFITYLFSTSTGNWVPFVLFIFFTVIGLVFAYSMPRRTPNGYSFYRQIKGLSWYLEKGKWRHEIAEKNLFIEEILPLAVAIGIVGKIAKDMKDLDIKPPSYFVGSSIAAFSSDVSSFNSVSASSLTPPKGSSSWSGGSGFSGGGFSGGGFGGGGGGSW